MCQKIKYTHAFYAHVGIEFVASAGVEPVTRNRGGMKSFHFFTLEYCTIWIITYLKIHIEMQHFMISLWELIGIKEDITLLNFNKIWAKSFMKIGVWDCKIDNHNLVSNF